MYLVSIYFDNETNHAVTKLTKQVAKKTGNTYMLDNNVPPHITVSSFQLERVLEEKIISILNEKIHQLESGKITWVTTGMFFPHVLYIAPYVSEYLHSMSVEIHDALTDIDGISIGKTYQPFQWFPHTTIGKRLTNEEMKEAFLTMQNMFVPFEGKVTKIGLAKTNPYTDIYTWKLRG